ncbi:MAG TPA: hypothetical protein VH419_06290, partial [Nocardioidaceae bacterium]|jgi:hypothetical protein
VRLQALITAIRDVGFLVVGFGGVIYQQLTGKVNPWLLAVFTTMLGIPGAIGLLQLRGGSGKQTVPTTPSPPSSSPSSSSPSPPQ